MFHGGKFRRGAAVLLAAVLTAGLAAGCGDKPAVSSGSSQSAGLSVKTVDLKQRKIRIYQYGFRKASITDTEDGRRLMNRVAEIEKAFNCVIELPEDDDYTAVWNATMAGQPSFDIMSVAAPHLFAQPATNGIFQDLNQFKDALDFSADKWSDQTNGLYQLSGKQFACAAESEGVNSLTGNLVMYFNKRLLKTLPIAWFFFAVAYMLVPWAESTIKEWLLAGTILPLAALTVAAASIAHVSAALALAGGSLAAGELTIAQAVFALLLGNSFGIVTRLFRANAGYYFGLFSREMAKQLLFWNFTTTAGFAVLSIALAALPLLF